MSTEPPAEGAEPPKPAAGVNPALRRDVDAEFTEDQHGSEPMETISVKHRGPEVWPIVWAVVAISLILLTIWLVT
jgi:hypothetical protein